MVSTPNAERLETTHVLCPDCGAIFHPAQHLQSWTRDRVEATARRKGLEPVATRTLRLSETWLEGRMGATANLIKQRLGVQHGPSKPNLLFASRKPR